MARYSSIDQLRRQLLAGLGVASLIAACGGQEVSDGEDEGGVTTNPSSSASTVGSESSEDAGTSGPGTTPDPDPNPDPPDPDPDPDPDPYPEPKLDLPPSDMMPADGCTVMWTDIPTLDDYPECAISLGDGDCEELYWGCVPLTQGSTCEELCPDGDCVEDWFNCAGDMPVTEPASVCGPYEIDGQCCSLGEVDWPCGTDGRPFIVGGQGRQAALAGGASRGPSVGAAARRWRSVARAEHASIASIAQFATDLLTLGAPASLVRDAIAAARDEVAHAEFALTRATQLGGAPLYFAALEVDGAGVERGLEAIVVACIREGCVGETLAALELSEAARGCGDPQLASALEVIAADERRHASLAWRFVQWALGQAPELRGAVEATFAAIARGHELAGQIETLAPAELASLRAQGCLSGRARRRLATAALDGVVRPCAAALVGQC